MVMNSNYKRIVIKNSCLGQHKNTKYNALEGVTAKTQKKSKNGEKEKEIEFSPNCNPF